MSNSTFNPAPLFAACIGSLPAVTCSDLIQAYSFAKEVEKQLFHSIAHDALPYPCFDTCWPVSDPVPYSRLTEAVRTYSGGYLGSVYRFTDDYWCYHSCGNIHSIWDHLDMNDPENEGYYEQLESEYFRASHQMKQEYYEAYMNGGVE